jgi:hypothetical protein
MIHREWSVPFVEAAGVATVEGGIVQAGREREELERQLGQAWEAEGGVLEGAIRIEKFGPGHPTSGIGLEGREKLRRSCWKDLRIGVQKPHEGRTPTGGPQIAKGKVIAGGKAQVLLAGDHVHSGEHLRYHLR